MHCIYAQYVETETKQFEKKYKERHRRVELLYYIHILEKDQSKCMTLFSECQKIFIRSRLRLKYSCNAAEQKKALGIIIRNGQFCTPSTSFNLALALCTSRGPSLGIQGQNPKNLVLTSHSALTSEINTDHSAYLIDRWFKFPFLGFKVAKSRNLSDFCNFEPQR